LAQSDRASGAAPGGAPGAWDPSGPWPAPAPAPAAPAPPLPGFPRGAAAPRSGSACDGVLCSESAVKTRRVGLGSSPRHRDVWWRWLQLHLFEARTGREGGGPRPISHSGAPRSGQTEEKGAPVLHPGLCSDFRPGLFTGTVLCLREGGGSFSTARTPVARHFYSPPPARKRRPKPPAGLVSRGPE